MKIQITNENENYRVTLMTVADHTDEEIDAFINYISHIEDTGVLEDIIKEWRNK